MPVKAKVEQLNLDPVVVQVVGGAGKLHVCALRALTQHLLRVCFNSPTSDCRKHAWGFFCGVRRWHLGKASL